MAKVYSMKFGSGDPRTLTGLSPTFLIFVNLSSGATVAPPAISESATSWGIYQFTWGTTTPIAFLADAATTSPGTAGRYVTGQIDPSDRADEYGTTLVAIGTTAIALGITNVALGTTSVSSFAALGSTLVAIGNTGIALGNTSIALETNQGATLIAVGNTAGFGVALGTSIYALEQAIASTLLAVGGVGASIMTSIGSTASSFGNATTDPGDLFGYLKRLSELEQGQEKFVKGAGTLTWLDRTGGVTLNQRTVVNSSSMVVKS
jgi:hypothetical protein